MLKEHYLHFLGISDKEAKILKSMEHEQKSIFVLSRDVGIPRGTLYPIIEKLYKRGFIKVSKSGKRFIYKTIDTKDLQKKLFEIAHSLGKQILHEEKIAHIHIKSIAKSVQQKSDIQIKYPTWMFSLIHLLLKR